jgi:hypothetical protein
MEVYAFVSSGKTSVQRQKTQTILKSYHELHSKTTNDIHILTKFNNTNHSINIPRVYNRIEDHVTTDAMRVVRRISHLYRNNQGNIQLDDFRFLIDWKCNFRHQALNLWYATSQSHFVLN